MVSCTIIRRGKRYFLWKRCVRRGSSDKRNDATFRKIIKGETDGRKQLQYEFLSILSESHPGLTFEEYRDSCVFLLFYQYLCLKHGDSLEETYKPGELVKMAIRGKLQVASFLKFMESASSFLHLLNKDFQLTEFSFYKSLERVHSLEKQKSYARFFS